MSKELLKSRSSKSKKDELPTRQIRVGTFQLVALVGLFFFGACHTPLLDTTSTLSAEPNAVECKQWDDAFLALFDLTFLASTVAPILFAPFLGLFGRRSWFFAAPLKRVVVPSMILAFVAIVLVPLSPFWLPLGQFWLANVDPRYLDCADKSFGAEGLLFGLISLGQAAISQWHVMVPLILGGVTVGCFSSILLQVGLARFFGIRRNLAGGEDE